MNLADLTSEVAALVRKTGKFLLTENQQFKQEDIRYKGKNDLVSYVDEQAEQQLMEALRRLLPNAEFIAEEHAKEIPKQLDKGTYWIIDPIDGTTNFLHQVPLYSISIALMEKGELVLGVVYEPNRDECFYTWKGESSFLNGKPISVSHQTDLNKTLIATGFPYTKTIHIDEHLNGIKNIILNTHGIRRFGSAAIDLAYTAAGRFDAFYEYQLKPWDVAAGILLVENAGGKVQSFRKGLNPLTDKEILAGNPHILSGLHQLILPSPSK